MEFHRANFEITGTLDGGPSNNSASSELKMQNEMWAQELRRADERAQKFKDEVDRLLDTKRQLKSENDKLVEKVHAREEEIARLHKSYRGGQTFDEVKTNYHLEKMEQDHDFYLHLLKETCNMLGLPFQPEGFLDDVYRVKSQI